jgi:hypothetical protein
MLNPFGFEPRDFLFLAVFLGLLVLPIIRIVQRTGHSGWWGVLMFVPFANIIGLQILAYGRWPVLGGKNSD